ncbi:MAG: DUF1284 domain-containing protein [Methanomassiliicoccales archaeon]
MKEIRLRHHHLLCTRTFGGRGYDYRFVANMEDVVSRLRSPDGLVIRLGVSCDDVCSQCPNAVRGLCKDHESVVDKDRSAALFLSLPDEGTFPAGPLLAMVEERLRELDDIRLVCGECEWAELCNERLRTR